MIKLITPCRNYSGCWEPMCTDVDWICPLYKPRLFGFIPVNRKFGERLEYIQEKLFFKFCVKNNNEPLIDWEKDF